MNLDLKISRMDIELNQSKKEDYLTLIIIIEDMCNNFFTYKVGLMRCILK